jgi:hypothetical protein
MRRIVVAAAIALLPVLAHSQTSTVAGAQTAQPAPSLQAKLMPMAAPAQPAVARIAVAPRGVHSVVTVKVEQLLPQNNSGTLAYTLLTDTTPRTISTLPVLLQSTAVDLDHVDAPKKVSVHMIINADGTPSDLEINGKNDEISHKVMTALSQYRFKAATVNHEPVASDVIVDVKLAN